MLSVSDKSLSQDEEALERREHPSAFRRRESQLLMTVDRTTLTARYFAVPTQRDPANAPSQQIDAFTLNLATHQLQ
jgi:hypothetical protein